MPSLKQKHAPTNDPVGGGAGKKKDNKAAEDMLSRLSAAAAAAEQQEAAEEEADVAEAGSSLFEDASSFASILRGCGCGGE